MLISGLDRPARSSACLRFASWVAPRHARLGFPGGGFLPGQDLFELSMFTSHSHLLSVAGLCRRTPQRSPNRRNYRSGSGQLSAARDFTGSRVEDGRSARPRIFGFETSEVERRLRSFLVAYRGSNIKNLADLPSSCPPCRVPLDAAEGRYVSFCERSADWQARLSARSRPRGPATFRRQLCAALSDRG